MLSSGDPSRIVPFPSPVSRPYDLLCFVLYDAQNQTLPEMPTLTPPRITVVGSYATGLTMKIQRLPSHRGCLSWCSKWLVVLGLCPMPFRLRLSGLRRPYTIIY